MHGARRNQFKSTTRWFNKLVTNYNPEMICKLLKASGVTLSSDGSEYYLFIGHNGLLGDDKEMIEQVEQLAISNDQVEELKHNLNDTFVIFRKILSILLIF